MKRKYFYSKCASSEQDNKHEKITPVVSYPDKRFAYLSCWPLTVTLSCKFNQTDVCLMAAILLLNHYVGVLWVIQLQKWIYQFTQVSLLVMYCMVGSTTSFSYLICWTAIAAQFMLSIVLFTDAEFQIRAWQISHITLILSSFVRRHLPLLFSSFPFCLSLCLSLAKIRW